MIKNFFCTRCGAPIEAESTREFIFCTRCGSRESVPTDAATAFSRPAMPAHAPAVPQINRPSYPSETPNLIVNYSTIRPDVTLIIRIPETNLMYQATGIMSIPFLMTPGNHTLFLKIGKRNYSRIVLTYASGAPVIVNCSWDGRARIDIQQPFMPNANMPYYPQPNYAQPQAPQQYQAQQQYAQPQPAAQQQYIPQQTQPAEQQYVPPQTQPEYVQPPAAPTQTQPEQTEQTD